MKNTQVLSVSKVIFFAVFISAALMTSLFLYHGKQKATLATLSNDAGTIFAAPRDLKPFKLITGKGEAFTPTNLQKHWTLLFFGFTHCGNICPTTLEKLNRAYTSLHERFPNLQIAFISLDPERDTPETLQTYTESYNKNFIAVTGKQAEIRKLQSQLGIFASLDPDNDNSKENYQLMHSGTIALINPKGEWVGIYKNNISKDQLVYAFNESMKFV